MASEGKKREVTEEAIDGGSLSREPSEEEPSAERKKPSGGEVTEEAIDGGSLSREPSEEKPSAERKKPSGGEVTEEAIDGGSLSREPSEEEPSAKRKKPSGGEVTEEAIHGGSLSREPPEEEPSAKRKRPSGGEVTEEAIDGGSLSREPPEEKPSAERKKPSGGEVTEEAIDGGSLSREPSEEEPSAKRKKPSGVEVTEKAIDGGSLSREPPEEKPSAKRKKPSAERKKPRKKPSGGEKKGKAESGGGGSDTDWSGIQWAELGKTKDGRPWTLKLSSWNVNGIRALLKNGGFEYLNHEKPDIFCVQETKCAEADLPMEQLYLQGYNSYWHSAQKKGYSGVGLYSKEKPIKVTKGIGIEKYDCEGRLIVAEYQDFYFLVSYVPNAGEGLKRLSFKLEWDTHLREYMVKLDKVKPVILCGDLNVAHQEIDLKNPKTNRKTAGFTPEERRDFSLLLQEGFVDVFRSLYPDRQHAYTYWSYRFHARAKDTGWRLDYFVVSERLVKNVTDCVIRKGVFGSDHCPLVLGLTTSADSVEDQSPVEPSSHT